MLQLELVMLLLRLKLKLSLERIEFLAIKALMQLEMQRQVLLLRLGELLEMLPEEQVILAVLQLIKPVRLAMRLLDVLTMQLRAQEKQRAMLQLELVMLLLRLKLKLSLERIEFLAIKALMQLEMQRQVLAMQLHKLREIWWTLINESIRILA